MQLFRFCASSTIHSYMYVHQLPGSVLYLAVSKSREIVTVVTCFSLILFVRQQQVRKSLRHQFSVRYRLDTGSPQAIQHTASTCTNTTVGQYMTNHAAINTQLQYSLLIIRTQQNATIYTTLCTGLVHASADDAHFVILT